MSATLTLDALRAAMGSASSAGGGATARLVDALEAIGWRGVDSASAEDVAEEVLPALTGCAREHGDIGLLYRQVAEVLRASGPVLDGGMPPVSDYIPAAALVVRRFVERA